MKNYGIPLHLIINIEHGFREFKEKSITDHVIENTKY